MNKRVEKQMESKTKHKRADVADKLVGDEMVFTDLHENVIRERMIPYRMPVINDDLTLRNSQIFYEEMKMRRSCRQFSTRDVPLKLIQNLLKTAGKLHFFQRTVKPELERHAVLFFRMVIAEWIEIISETLCSRLSHKTSSQS
uniref:Nitroreductase domain-containing protein n=1 Tax=Caenorhabditis japonica TaxID=281687 RepID=A0A8R1HUY2_CAEJA